jgi:hypothetical protein
MKKIGGIKTELEKLLNAWFNLFEKWKAAGPKLNKGALNLEYLLFHPLGLPALKAALRTLPPSIPGGVTIRGGPQTGEGPKTGGETKAKREGPQTGREAKTGGGATTGEGSKTGGEKRRLRYRGRGLGAQQRKVEPEGSPTYSLPPGGKETDEKKLQDEITRAINFIEKRQVDDAIKAVANAITILRDIGKQKPQTRGALPEHLRYASALLGAALDALRQATRLGPDSEGFNADRNRAISLLGDALSFLSNQTAGSTSYLGRKLLLLMKTLHSTPTTAQSHRQRAKNEDILEKETI